jgi:FKBP-type peptidyl-prolyl cis-trans isomerase 2
MAPIEEGWYLPKVNSFTLVKVDDEVIHVDFNKPQSGYTVTLDVELLKITKAIPHPIFQNHHCVRVAERA